MSAPHPGPRPRAGEDLEKLVEAIPYGRWLGLRATLRDGEVVTHMPPADHLIGNPLLPALHGGTIGALLESAAIFELIWDSRVARVPKTISLTVEYLRSARLVDTYAAAKVTRQGRRVANVQVFGWQADRNAPVAHAHAHFLLRSPDDGSQGES